MTAVAVAALAEMASIQALRANLEKTVAALHTERSEVVSQEAAAAARTEVAQRRIDALLAADVASQRSAYSELVERQAELRRALSILRRVDELEQARMELMASRSEDEPEPIVPAILPASVADDFSREMEGVLRSWHFPGSGRVHFDNGTRDFIVAGQPRSSYGKGLRAVTHAAFTVTLLKYCSANTLPHPGFIVLDSPLLAYREPEEVEPSLVGSDLRERFYSAVAADTDSQLIIVENEHPPAELNAAVTVFTNNPVLGRQGLFPRDEHQDSGDVSGNVAA